MKSILVLIIGVLVIISCTQKGPQTIELNKDGCDFCKMSIADGRFGAEVITKKGRVYKFDDLSCMMGYIGEAEQETIANFYVSDFSKENMLIDATKAHFVKNPDFRSPMGGNTARFFSKDKAQEFATKYETKILSWSDLEAESHMEHAHH